MLRMLSVAINDYPEGDRRLRGCLNDSAAWLDWFDRRGWQVESLINEQATGIRIAKAIGRLMNESSPGDRVAIHFSGHGSQVPDLTGDEQDGWDECYCPWDVRTSGPLRDDTLYHLFQQRAEDVRLYVIADCCHSGSLHRDSQASSIRYLPLERSNPRVGQRRAAAAVRTAGLLLAACGEGERAREITIAGRSHGLLTHLALLTLRDLPSEATHRTWLTAMEHASRQTAQKPRIVGSDRLLDEPVFGGL